LVKITCFLKIPEPCL